MRDDLLVQRFAGNPLVTPGMVPPSRPDWIVEGVLNPGAFMYQDRIGLLLRVEERLMQEPGWQAVPMLNPNKPDGVEILRVRRSDPAFHQQDPRLFRYRGAAHLTTLSHLRLAWSTDGVHFTVDPAPTLTGHGSHEAFGIEDVRIVHIAGTYYLTYTAASAFGYGVGMITTRDWSQFARQGLIMPPPNKHCVLFPEALGGRYLALHRSSGAGLGGNYIWISRSPDLHYWGEHQCLARTRPGFWDGGKIGVGAAPIRTDEGWLVLYHGADQDDRYCLGALLVDLQDPTRVLARSDAPLMEPTADYEEKAVLGDAIFSNGCVVQGDRLTLYYGASMQVVCGATLQISEVIKTLDGV